MTSFKVLAAAALLAGGLGVGVGAGWTGAANGQPPGSPVDPEAEVRRLQAELDKARQAAAARPGREAAPPADPRWETTAITEWLAEGGRGAPAPKWEYEFVPARDLGPDQFRDLLRDREGRGWEFGGTTPLTRDGKPAATWVFRRPAAGAGGPWRRLATPVGADPSGGDPAAADGPVADNPEAIRAEIARLQARLAASEPKPVTDPAARRRVEFRKQDLPLEPAEAVALLGRLAERKFGKGRLVISLADGGVAVEGDREAFDWFAGVVKALGGKAPADPRVGQ